jgi:hypothetical protein
MTKTIIEIAKAQAATERPCPKTSDCLKSSIAAFISSAKIDGVAVLDSRFVYLAHDPDFARLCVGSLRYQLSMILDGWLMAKVKAPLQTTLS